MIIAKKFFLQKNKKFVAVQPKILDMKNKDKFEYSGAAGGFIDYFGTVSYTHLRAHET